MKTYNISLFLLISFLLLSSCADNKYQLHNFAPVEERSSYVQLNHKFSLPAENYSQPNYIQHSHLYKKNTAKIKNQGQNVFFHKKSYTKKHWIWPVLTKKKKYHLIASKNKILAVRGSINAQILSVDNGRVVYSGNGLKGYGNLIIIKHSNNLLSAYALNKQLFVHEGQLVKSGQVIALMGTDENGESVLHFEARRYGKPINPLLLL